MRNRRGRDRRQQARLLLLSPSIKGHMELRDGFIVGVFNYCDSWCATCPFTSRCLVFADIAETEAARDSSPSPAPDVLPAQKAPSPLPTWIQELIDEMTEAAVKDVPEPVLEPLALHLVPEHSAIDARAEEYSRRARNWLKQHEPLTDAAPGEPRSVVSWFHMLIHVKAMRALRGLAEDDPADRNWPADHDGSAKVALIGIDRSQTAWLDLVDRGLASPEEAASFVEDLSWLRDALERTFPNAREFVRPGFDEPAQVATLLSSLE
jgi:hypothetical protein